jgi:uncharacterized integral membrane protein
MKKATLIIWVIIFGFIALVIFQNQTFFLAKQSLRINLGVFQEYHSPELPNAVLALFFFFAGLLIAYLFNFPARFKARRTIKKLNATIADHNGELSELRREINTLKGIAPPTEAQTETAKIDLDTTQRITDESPADTTQEITDESPADKTQKITGEGSADNTKEYAFDSQALSTNENTEEKSEDKIQ